MRKTRKIISFILVISMVLSLSGCSTIKLHSDKIDLRIKGSGKKVMTLTVWGEFPENMEKDVRIMSDGEGKEPLQLTVKKETGSKIVYQFKGLKSCNSSLIIKYTVGTEDYALINMPIGITSDLKIICGSVILDGNNDYKPITGNETEVDGNLDGEISTSSGVSKTIKLNAGDGTWNISSYNEEVLSVSDEGYEEGYCTFIVAANAVGVGDLILVNKEEGKQLKLSFAVTEYKNDEGEAAELTLTLTDSQAGDYDGGEEYSEALEKYQLALEGLLKTVYIPSNAKIEDFILSKISGEDVKVDYDRIYQLQQQLKIGAGSTEDADNMQKQLDEIFASVDTADMQLTMDGHDLFYMITKAMNKDQLKAYMFEGLEFANEGVIYSGDRVIDSVLSSNGLGAALWTEGDNACILIFVDEMEESAIDSMVELFFK